MAARQVARKSQLFTHIRLFDYIYSSNCIEGLHATFSKSYSKEPASAFAGSWWVDWADTFDARSCPAHFLWLTAEGDKPSVHAFLSETPTPDGPEFLKHIEHARITSGGKGLSWTKAEDTFRVNLLEPLPDVVDGFCDLGVKNRGGVSFSLIYTARVQFGPSAAGTAEEADHLRMRLVAQPGQAPFVLARFRGQPASGVVVKAFPAEGDAVELKSDQEGHVVHPLVGKDGTAFIGKRFEKAPGNRDGKPYDEVRYYELDRLPFPCEERLGVDSVAVPDSLRSPARSCWSSFARRAGRLALTCTAGTPAKRIITTRARPRSISAG